MLEAIDVWKVYPTEGGPVEAIRGVDLTVAEGEFIAVMGPSGCGKSTLLHLVGGITAPTAGSVQVDGQELSRLSERSRARLRRHKIGFVFQFQNLIPVLSVEDNAALPVVIAGGSRKSGAARLGELLEAVGISDQARKLPSQLSGGEQQRAAIVRALIMEPAVLLADEPTGNLDSKSAGEVLALFQMFHREGQTIVLVTHDHAVASLAERVVTMRDGRIVDEAILPAGRKRSAAIAKLVDLEL